MYYADLKRGEEQAEADRLLGQLVRKMPKDTSLIHDSVNEWMVQGRVLRRGNTPEEALKAALEG